MPTLDEYARVGIAAIEEKRFDDAIEAFTRALELEPDRPDMNNALAMAYLHRGDAGNAIPPLERAVALAEPYDQPGHQPLKRDFHLTLASAYQLMDRVEDARRTLEGAIARWPEESGPRLRLAQLLAVSGRVAQAAEVWRAAAPLLDGEQSQAIEALVGSYEAWRDSGEGASIFLQAHCDSYRDYFDTIAAAEAEKGLIAEAARMSRNAEGEMVPILADGARPYALSRVDLVDPASGAVSSVYSDTEPMIVAVKGLEPLAQVPLVLPWQATSNGVGNALPFLAFVCTQCPWHWLQITIRFEVPAEHDDALVARVDDLFGGWYLAGFNGEFGDASSGRFHYVTDPERVGARAVAYVVDLGRARYDAVGALLRRLVVLHDTHPIERVVFGQGRLPE